MLTHMEKGSAQYYLHLYFSEQRILVLTALLLAVGYWFSYPIQEWLGWCQNGCLLPLHSSVAITLEMMMPGLVGILLTFLFLPVQYIRIILRYYLSWAVPLALIFIMSTPVSSGGFFALPDREIAALISSFALLLGTCALICIFVIYNVWRWYQNNSGDWG